MGKGGDYNPGVVAVWWRECWTRSITWLGYEVSLAWTFSLFLPDQPHHLILRMKSNRCCADHPEWPWRKALVLWSMLGALKQQTESPSSSPHRIPTWLGNEPSAQALPAHLFPSQQTVQLLCSSKLSSQGYFASLASAHCGRHCSQNRTCRGMVQRSKQRAGKGTKGFFFFCLSWET